MTKLDDGENALGKYGAATMVGRNGAEVQVRIFCGTEAEAKRIVARVRADIAERGQTVMVIGGTLDEQASAGVKQ